MNFPLSFLLCSTWCHLARQLEYSPSSECLRSDVCSSGDVGASLCKVNCCNIRPQRALYILILPEFCHCLPEFLLLSATFIILQPSGGKLPWRQFLGQILSNIKAGIFSKYKTHCVRGDCWRWGHDIWRAFASELEEWNIPRCLRQQKNCLMFDMNNRGNLAIIPWFCWFFSVWEGGCFSRVCSQTM